MHFMVPRVLTVLSTKKCACPDGVLVSVPNHFTRKRTQARPMHFMVPRVLTVLSTKKCACPDDVLVSVPNHFTRKRTALKLECCREGKNGECCSSNYVFFIALQPFL